MSKSPSLRRIQADLRELSIDPSPNYHAAPLEHDMFEWHFTIRGAPNTDFENGLYHGRILLPAEYPFKPPNIVFLTPSGRFEVNTKVCLSFSAYHPELWQPAWGIRLILEALISFLPTKGDGAIGALDWTSAERKRLAAKSGDYVCPQCGCSNREIMQALDERIAASAAKRKKNDDGKDTGKSKFQKEIEQLHALQAAAEGNRKQNEEKGDKKSETGEVLLTEEANDSSASDPQVVDSEEPNETQCLKTEATNDKAISTTDEPVGTSSVTSTSQKDTDKLVMDEDKGEANNEANISNTEMGTEIKPGEESIIPPVTDPLSENDDTTSITDTDTILQIEEDENPNKEADTSDDADIQDQNDHGNNNNTSNSTSLLDSPLFSDPVVHVGIVLFSIIILLLVRKIQSILVDLKELEAQIKST